MKKQHQHIFQSKDCLLQAQEGLRKPWDHIKAETPHGTTLVPNTELGHTWSCMIKGGALHMHVVKAMSESKSSMDSKKSRNAQLKGPITGEAWRDRSQWLQVHHINIQDVLGCSSHFWRLFSWLGTVVLSKLMYKQVGSEAHLTRYFWMLH